MILRAVIDDATAQRIDQIADHEGKARDLVVNQLLRAALALPGGSRTLTLDVRQIEALEAILKGGSVLNGQDLVAKTARLAGITFGHIRLDFSPGQLEEIASRAERLSLTPEELIRRTARKMEELFFTHLGTGMQHGV